LTRSLERLAQRLDGVAAELGELVEEEHAVVREGSDISPEREGGASGISAALPR
jgi:hypothetical protein